MAGELITSDWQIQYGGLVMGMGTAYDIEELTGWDDMPALDRTDVARPARHGAWAGALYLQARTITVTGRVRGPGRAAYQAAMDALRAVTNPPDGDTSVEVPLAVRQTGRTLWCGARCIARAMPTTRGYIIPGRDKVSLQWTATDPRRYGIVTHSTGCRLPQPGGGLTYPLAYPLDYGSAGTSGSLIATNAGDISGSPTLIITGPATNPVIANQTTGVTLVVAATLAASDLMIIDTADATVTLNGAGASALLDTSSASPGSFTLAPGPNAIVFRATDHDPGALLSVRWSDTYL